MMNSIKTVIFCAAMAFPLSAQAATVTYTEAGGTLSATLVATDAAAWGMVNQGASVALPKGATWETDPADPYAISVLGEDEISLPGDACRNACSPFYGGVFGEPEDAGAAGWKTTEFFTVYDPKVAGTLRSVVLAFAQPQKSLSLLWGSADLENMIDLLLDGMIVGTFKGSDLNDFGAGVVRNPGSGAALLSLTGLTFDGVRFSTEGNKGSFEFSNVTTVPAAVPLPPAMLALLAALGLLGALSRRRTGHQRARLA